MSMIICPECKERVSSLAGTCPHCGIAIRGMIRQCPYCNTYVMKNAERCDTCKNILQPITENSDQDSPSVTTGNQQRKRQNPKKKKRGMGIVKGLLDFFKLVKKIRHEVKVVKPQLVYVTPNACGGAFYKDFVVVPWYCKT